MTTKTTTKAASELTLDECREEYRAIRGRSHLHNAKAFDAEVSEKVDAREPEAGFSELGRAQEFVQVARTLRVLCRRCAGTGAFVTGTMNGQPTGPGGSATAAPARVGRTTRTPAVTTGRISTSGSIRMRDRGPERGWI